MANKKRTLSAAQKLRRKEKRKQKRKQKKGTPKGVASEVAHVKREVAALKRKTDGPKQQDSYHLTVDLGLVSSSAVDAMAKQLSVLLNPLQMKTPGQPTTALVTKASLYQQWRLQDVKLHFTPLVGSSAVAGTIVLATLVQDAGATGEVNVNNIYARPHVQLEVGKSKTWTVPQRTLTGPRNGWWMVDPDHDQSITLGAMVEVWTYGETMSTYQATPFKGNLFRVRATVTYGFTSFDPKPDLQTLEKTEPEMKEMLAHVDADGNAVVEMKSKATGLKAGPMPHHAESNSVSDVIWACSDAVVDTLSTVFPEWSWLIKGGWWFIKKIAGKELQNWLRANPAYATANDNDDLYYIYQSYDDARTSRPWKPPGHGGTQQQWNGDVSFIQLTPLQAGTIGVQYPFSLRTPMLPILFSQLPTGGGLPAVATYVNTTHHYPLRPQGSQWVSTNDNWTLPTFVPIHAGSATPSSQPWPGNIYTEGPICYVGDQLIYQNRESVVLGTLVALVQRMRSAYHSGVLDPWMSIRTGSLRFPGSATDPEGASMRCVTVGVRMRYNSQATNVAACYGHLVYTEQLHFSYTDATNISIGFTLGNPASFLIFNTGGVITGQAMAATEFNASASNFTSLHSVTFWNSSGKDGGTTTVDGRGVCVETEFDDDDDFTPSARAIADFVDLEEGLTKLWSGLDGWTNLKMGHCVMCKHRMAHTLEMCIFMRFRNSTTHFELKGSPFEDLGQWYNPELYEKEVWSHELTKAIYHFKAGTQYH
uniref:Capsid protein n=1 Tax=Hainan marbled pigmy frog astrovirus 1 TaxID=2116327 RepID=A0A2P1GMF2_9VIRU|nr:capsid protein [Hainan marbled pigmy frog astrovirus 1]